LLNPLGKNATILAFLIAIAVSGCGPRYIDQPYAVEVSVPSVNTQPLEQFPKLPPINEMGERNFCDMHQYRVQIEYILCAEYKRLDNMIYGITDGRQRFAIPEDCEAINYGVRKGLHRACESK